MDRMVKLLYNPYVLLFFTISLGLVVGKVKLVKFRLGSSGALFVGLVIGYLVIQSGSQYVEAAGIGKIVDQNLFTMSLIFFVASVGLLAAKDVGVMIKKYGVKFVLLGVLVTVTGAGGSYLASGLIDGASVYSMSGVYTGALTSSPGLASAVEAAENQSQRRVENYAVMSQREQEAVWMLAASDAELAAGEAAPATLSKEQQERYLITANSQVGMGYAIAYPFGVIVVILAVNLLPVIFRIDVAKELRQYNAEMKSRHPAGSNEETFDIIGLAVVFLVGYLVGSIKIPLGPLGDVSLEVTGGVLMTALLLGHIGQIGRISFRMSERVLDIIREIAVVFFLAIVGLNYGYGAVTALLDKGLLMAVMSLVIATAAILVGFLVGRYVFKINWIMLAGALCGGMTSTPGLGAAIEATGSEGPAGGYGATYPFALLGMILFTIVMYILPTI